MNDTEIIESSTSGEEYSDSYNIYTDSVNIIVNESEEDSTVQEETEEIQLYLQDLEEDDPVAVTDIVRSSSDSLRAVSYSDIKDLWTVQFNNREYKVLFPHNTELDVIDGKIVNRGSSNVTGAVIANNFSDSNYIEDTITVVPLYSSGSQTQVYRYGSRSYLTHYSPGQNNNLVSSVSYGPVEVVHRPAGFSFSKEGITIIAILLGLLIVQFIGGLIRR